jgi:hypothetical protein
MEQSSAIAQEAREVLTNPDRRARTDQRAHPVARAWFAVLRDRGEQDLWFVLHALEARRDVAAAIRRSSRSQEPRSQRALLTEDQAIEIYTGFYRATGQISTGAYDSYRDEHPELDLPSRTALRNAVGGRWLDLQSKLGVALGVDATARALTAQGPAYLPEEITGPFRAWASGIEGELVPSHFFRWAGDEMKRVPRRWPRIPRSQDPIDRVFDSWQGLLDAEGYGHRGRGSLNGAPQRAHAASADEYTAETCHEMVRIAARSMSGRWLSHGAHDRWAKKTRSEMRAVGTAVRIPSADTIVKVCESTWPQVLVDAGVAEEAMAALQSGTSFELPEVLLWQAFASAIAECGEQLSTREYINWKDEQLVRAARMGRSIWLPCCSTLETRLGDGSWLRARARVIEWMSGRDESAGS